MNRPSEDEASARRVLWPVRSPPPPRLPAQRLQALALRLRVPVAIFLAVNLILAAGYLWSRGGQTTHVRVKAQGDVFEAYVDGDLMIRQRVVDAPVRGGLALSVEHTRKIPSLPKPRGVDHVRVTDLRSGVELFEDDFSNGQSDEWTVAAGRVVDEGGVLDIQGDGAIALIDRPWIDIVVDVDFKNVIGAAVLLRGQDSRTGVVYSLRPFRQYDSALSVIEQGQVKSSYTAGRAVPARSETLKSLVAMTLRPYPLVAILLAAGFLLVLGLQFADLLGGRLRLPKLPGDLLWFGAVAALAAGAFGVTLFLIYAYGARMPHVQDSVSYVFQAKLFASGRLTAPAPPVAEVFDYAVPPFVVVSDGTWATVYPFGHPLALAIGERIGAIWLVPPLLGAASIVLTFAIGRRMYHARLGLLAALLFASSPFFFMTASNFMSHNTAVFYLLVSLLFLVIGDRRPLLYRAAAGLFFGLLFNTQSLAAVALIPCFGLLLLSRLFPASRRKTGALQVSAFAAGGLVMLAAYYLFNFAARGDPLTTGFAAAGFPSSIGFGGDHSVDMGIENERTQMTFLLLVLNGWPQQIGLMFVLGLLALATRSRWDWFLLACAVSLIGVYTLFAGHGIMHGPRYWYPATPFLLLLTARGADRAAEVLADAAALVRRALTGVARRPRWAGWLVVYALVAALVGSAISSWVLSRHIAWDADFVPERAVRLQGFNGADDRLIKLIAESDLDNALVMVADCPVWQCYGTVFWLNSPTLDGKLVIARDVPVRRAELLRAYPDRRVYVAAYEPPSLVPFGAGPDAVPGRPEGPLARDIAVLLPTPTPTAGPEASLPRDDQRRRDLGTIASALQQYYERRGAYPLAGAVQSLCRYRELDAGCSLLEVLDPLPQDPAPGSTYYYLSDGITFTLFAVMENPTDSLQCPVPRPPELAGPDHLYCLRGGR